MSFCTIHPICRQAPKGVAVCIVDPDKKQVLLGLERFGKYRGKFNLCAGSLEPEDGGCAVNAAKRELREEFKLDMHHFERVFGQNRDGRLRVTMVGPTPVLIGHVNRDLLPDDPLTRDMKTAIEDPTLPGTHKEMEQAQWFPWEDHENGHAVETTVETPMTMTMAWSRFARAALKKIAYRSSPRPMMIDKYASPQRLFAIGST